MKPIKTLSRDELYELVWTTPMVKLAEQFGLTDQGLAKKCKKHDIPRPPAGYWAKLEYGKSVEKTPLPSIADPALEVIEFHDKPESKKVERSLKNEN